MAILTVLIRMLFIVTFLNLVDSSESGEKKKIYRLGNDTLNGYRKYVNHYSTSDYAKTPYARVCCKLLIA